MRLASVLALTLLARLAVAQGADTTRRAPRVIVSGVVRDSIAHTTLAGAVVQLVARDIASPDARTTVSDSAGRFAFDSVAPGHYALGFFHPMLDSLGLESAARELVVEGRRPVRADLAIPSPARVREALCGPRLMPSDAVVIGFVRDARDGAPVPNARVTAEWLEIAIRRGAVGSRLPHLVATTGERGWFALCNVPKQGTILLSASRGADSTDVLDLQVPPTGLLRRDLFLGAARTIALVDSITSTAQRLHTGDGRLNGVVVAGADSRPVAGAAVGISGGPQTRTNERGEWVLTNAPAGTRMFEVRALGYYPERRAVDVRAGAAPLRVTLSTMKAVLDTVKVNATRLGARQQAEFDHRRRSGAGRYVTAEEIAQRRPVFTSDLFRSMPGVRFDRTSSGSGQMGAPPIMVRGAVANWCTPAIYIDGAYMFELSADELDAFVQPDEITGIEVYTGATAPPEFQPGLNGCGSIVIWTNLDAAGNKMPLTKGRVITGFVVAAFAVLTTFFLTRH